MTSLRICLFGLLTLLTIPAWVQAQGTAGGGSATQSSGSAASGSTTTSSQGGSSLGGTGGGGAGGASALQQPQFTQFGQAAANAETGFIGRGNNQQAFVGGSNAGQQTVDAGGTARFSGLGGNGGGAGPASTSQARGGQMRIPHRIAFSVPPLRVPVLTANLQTQFSSLQSRLPGVFVGAVEPGHVVLSGRVDSEHSRKLAEAVARLEPGVRKVTNELEVQTGTQGPELPPGL